MKTNLLKLTTIAAFVVTILAFTALQSTPTRVHAMDDDPAVVYKAKCAMCHSPAAEKAYDPAKPVEEQTEVILKGKKGEKPPYMPGFEAKGMTKEQATALANYMISLRAPK